MATKTPKMKTYRVRREWTVTMECWVEVSAPNATAACAAAMETDDFDDQKIQDNSDGSTFIGAIETLDGDRLEVPYLYSFESLGD